MRRTKIVCTLGPASNEERPLREMILAGMDVARVNMSHGTHESHAACIGLLRRLAEEMNKTIAVLLDLQGPKIRLGELDGEMSIEVDRIVRLTTRDIVGRDGLIPVDYASMLEETKIGDQITLADGSITLEVTARNDEELEARALSSGVVSSRKGVHLPAGGNMLPALTEKDIVDLRFGIAQEVDWVALSFVRRAADADKPRRIMREMGLDIPLLAKIERRQALENIDELLSAFDGLMVARGDLGVEIDFVDVPQEQEKLIDRAKAAAKPVITATQMLLSMVHAPRPTRAEVSDVTKAINDGTDAVMLSEETAMGDHPARCVETMARIAVKADKLVTIPEHPYWELDTIETPLAIARATRSLAHLTGARLIVTPTTTGSTARLVASMHPWVPVLGLAASEHVVRRMNLYWGVIPRKVEAIGSAEQLFDVCRREALNSGLAKSGDNIIVTTGYPLNMPGSTSLLQVLLL